MNEPFSELVRQLRNTPGARAYSEVYAPNLQFYTDLEDAPRGYDWDGMRRGASSEHPFFVFQYTLEGWGRYEDRTGRWAQMPGSAFTALIPSEHRYYLPGASSGWKYLWLILFHPYVVGRITQCVRETGPVMAVEPSHPLIGRMIELHQSLHQRTPLDSVTREQMIFAFLWEYERYSAQSRPHAERERLLGEVRQFVLSSLNQSIGVDELARWRGMSRSNFSHFFKAATGIAPAAFVLHTRLEEARRLLLQSSDGIAEIAAASGFASPNHFCKIFRQHYHLSPGAFRRQLRSGKAVKR